MWWRTPVVLGAQEAEAGELLETKEVEVAVNRDCATALQPGQQSKILSQKKKCPCLVSYVKSLIFYLKFKKKRHQLLMSLRWEDPLRPGVPD